MARLVRDRIPIACLMLAAGVAHAQYVPMDFSTQTYNALNIHAGYVLNKNAVDAANRVAGVGAAGSPSAVSTVTTGQSNVAHQLATAFPEADRAAAERQFAALLPAFANLETTLGIPHGDVGGAMACLVIGSYEAYHDSPVDPALYQPVIRQLRAVVASSTGFVKASSSARRALYEQWAILGMLTLATQQALKGNPNPAVASRLHDAAAQYLTGLQLDPNKLRITEAGLVQ